jgi:hypothetical protein
MTMRNIDGTFGIRILRCIKPPAYGSRWRVNVTGCVDQNVYASENGCEVPTPTRVTRPIGRDAAYDRAAADETSMEAEALRR